MISKLLEPLSTYQEQSPGGKHESISPGRENSRVRKVPATKGLGESPPPDPEGFGGEEGTQRLWNR